MSKPNYRPMTFTAHESAVRLTVIDDGANANGLSSLYAITYEAGRKVSEWQPEYMARYITGLPVEERARTVLVAFANEDTELGVNDEALLALISIRAEILEETMTARGSHPLLLYAFRLYGASLRAAAKALKLLNDSFDKLDAEAKARDDEAFKRFMAATAQGGPTA